MGKSRGSHFDSIILTAHSPLLRVFFFFPSGLNLNHWGHFCLDAVQFSFTY